MGSYRFIFAFGTSLLIQAVTFQFVEAMGGGANGWRTVAIFYAVIGLIVNTISALSVNGGDNMKYTLDWLTDP